VTTASGLSSLEPLPGIPLSYELSQNYPNPFNPSTRISYSIGARGFVSLKVFDILGREVARLVGEMQEAGSYQMTWNGSDRGGIPVTSGVYFYRLESGTYSRTHKMILLR
jgi:hypothetical protein